MKKLGLMIFLFTTIVGGIGAQELNPKKIAKEIKRAITKFELDDTKIMELDNAKDLAKQLLKAPGQENNGEVWMLLGDVYAAYTGIDIKNSVLDPAYQPQYAEAATDAYDAYKKALDNTDDDKVKKQALQGMAGAIQSFSARGIAFFQNQDYEGAYSQFANILDINELMTENGMEPALGEEDLNNQIYLAGLAAVSGGNNEKAKMHYNNLKERGYDEPELYDGLFKATMEEDEEKAVEILTMGRNKYPDNLNLLYSEINYYLTKGDINQLENKLEMAIEQDPKNLSLYTTLGNVYDKTFQSKSAEGKMDEAQVYFDKAIAKFNQALEIKPDDATAIYSIGALYFNKAATLTKDLEVLSSDYSPAGVKKYDAKKAEIGKVFDEALPYFQKAEKVDPNDRNTLIALKEIYARKNDLEKSAEFKKRLEVIENGGKNASSFFGN